MVVIPKVLSWNPFLIVEGDRHLDWVCLYGVQLLLWHLLAAPEPSKWWHYACEASLLSIPVCGDFPFSSVTGELDPLDG